MQNFRLGQPPLVNEGDLFPLHWIWNHPSALASGWSFSLALLGILLAHEAGHYFFCRHHGIRASWPYVLPAPTLSGTAGAVIRIRSRIPSRRALIEVGIAGPIAGYLVALPTTILGILLSRPAGPGTAPALVQFHWPLTVTLLDRMLAAWLPGVPALDNLLPHPILIASWVGLFVTSLNLIPAGQLDGGHILYAISPRWHRRHDVCCAGSPAGDGRNPVDRMGAVGSDPASAGDAPSPCSVFPAHAVQASLALLCWRSPFWC